MDNAPPGAEILKLLGGEHLGAVCGEGDRDAEHGDVVPELGEGLCSCVFCQLENVEPVAVPVHNNQVIFGSKREEVSTDTLERIARLFWGCWWHGWVAGSIPGALRAGRPEVDEV